MRQRAHFNLLPVFIILAVAIVVFFPVLRRWQPWSDWFNSRPESAASVGPVRVWVNERSGFYYCARSTFYGKISPGSYMVQGEALQRGYRPAEEQPCR